MEDGVREVYLLDVPWMFRQRSWVRRLPQGAFFRGLLLPTTVLLLILILVPRLLLVAVLLILRFFMVLAYSSYEKVPGPVGCVTLIPALVIYFLLGLFRTVFQVLLDWNLTISGMETRERTYYVAWIIGPVIGTQD